MLLPPTLAQHNQYNLITITMKYYNESIIVPLPASSKSKLVSHVNPIVRSPTSEVSHGSYSDV